jgi:hypothetical protein
VLIFDLPCLSGRANKCKNGEMPFLPNAGNTKYSMTAICPQSALPSKPDNLLELMLNHADSRSVFLILHISGSEFSHYQEKLSVATLFPTKVLFRTARSISVLQSSLQEHIWCGRSMASNSMQQFLPKHFEFFSHLRRCLSTL